MSPIPFTRRQVLETGVALAAGSLAPFAMAQNIKPGGTLVIGSTQTPRHLDPAVQSGIATAVPWTQIFASPLRYDANWHPIPYLAKLVSSSEDGKTVTIMLRKDARSSTTARR